MFADGEFVDRDARDGEGSVGTAADMRNPKLGQRRRLPPRPFRRFEFKVKRVGALLADLFLQR